MAVRFVNHSSPLGGTENTSLQSTKELKFKVSLSSPRIKVLATKGIET